MVEGQDPREFEMARLELTVSEKGVEVMRAYVDSVGDGEAAGRLTTKTALACRLLHEAAKALDLGSKAEPRSYLDSIEGLFMFRCACSQQFNGPWDVARHEAISHVEQHHASKTIRRDLDSFEDVVEALVVPSPLNSWEQLQPGYWANLPTVKFPEGE